MNFFFPIHNNYLKCELCVPRFQNYKKTNDKFKLFSAEIKENKWEVKLVDCDFNKDFFFLTNKNFSNDKIFEKRNKHAVDFKIKPFFSLKNKTISFPRLYRKVTINHFRYFIRTRPSTIY